MSDPTDDDIAGRITGARHQLADVAKCIRDREPAAAEALLLIADDLGWVAWLARPTAESPLPSALLHQQHPVVQ
jgi:hypothetical protein